MSGSLLEVLTDNEYRANRSCVIAGLWTAEVCALICLLFFAIAMSRLCNDGQRQPKVDTWSTTQIIKCISRCKARAAADPEFAALVERDPAAAVKEVQA